MVSFSQSGNFSKINSYFERLKEKVNIGNLDKYGREGVAALSAHTPKDTGLLASSWYYTINRTKQRTELVFSNSDIENGCPIAIIVQYGHGTKNGGWIEGKDYINPALKPLFNRILNDVWREVTNL